MAKTAVEWLINQLKIRGYAGEFPPHLLFEQAKQMEKKQMKESWFDSTLQFDNAASIDKKEFEEYYNETYGKE